MAASGTGNYTIPQLPSGTYVLTVTVPGFKKFIRPGLVIQAAQTIRVDVTLEVGNSTESVTVQGEAPQLQTESGELSNTIATKTMDTLPLAGGRFQFLGYSEPVQHRCVAAGSLLSARSSVSPAPPCASTAALPDRRRS